MAEARLHGHQIIFSFPLGHKTIYIFWPPLQLNVAMWVGSGQWNMGGIDVNYLQARSLLKNLLHDPSLSLFLCLPDVEDPENSEVLGDDKASRM